MYDGHNLYKTVPEKINANTIIVAKIPHLILAIQVDFIFHAGVLEYYIKCIFGAFIPHEK